MSESDAKNADESTDGTTDKTDVEPENETDAAPTGEADTGAPEESDTEAFDPEAARATTAALSRARNAYVYAFVLLVVVCIMSMRSSFDPERLIPREARGYVRIAVVVVSVGGLVVMGLVVRHLMTKRAKALGDATATELLVAEDFVKAKTLAALIFGMAALLALLMIMAAHRKIDLLVLLVPLFLMFVSFPTRGAMKGFAGQVNQLHESQATDDQAEAD